ncbi:MAG: hypoxanthine-guanine phosphoribosyltransferase [SAR86 cluster bacterium]|uniref:Hypoxanthine-guanine phosphoribosyltransferase n=1 Tax=SAR86 cluster bacterium TaxID=2030880 RepID=A0A2A5AJC3_9GAMM|nr:MAG: hypoxanthine-guanine phosphoribosyltransferase [SAR86 cluster bacterium]
MCLVNPESITLVQSRARCVYTEQEVEKALDLMSEQITAELSDSNPIVMCIMNGGLVISGKLATRLAFPLQIDYLHATRYREQTSGSDLQWKTYPSQSLKGRVVLLVDDILDEGVTLDKIHHYCQQQGAEKVLSAVLLDKQHDRKVSDIAADFVGFKVEDFYLYGYGMDYKGYLRNAAGIYAVADEDL